MSTPDNSIKSNGAHIAQFKTQYSNQEASQLSIAKGTNPKTATTSLQGNINNLNSKQKTKMQLSATIGSKLLATGITENTARNFLKSSFDKQMDLNNGTKNYTKDLSNPSNRNPVGTKAVNPAAKIKNKKELILGERDSNYEGYMFPLDLTSNKTGATAWVKLAFYPYERPGPDQAGDLGTPMYIQLPIPLNLNETFNVRIDQKDTGFYSDSDLVAGALEAATNTLRNQQSVGAAMEELQGKFNLDVLRGAGMRAAFKGIGGIDILTSGAAGADSGALQGIYSQVLKSIPNPHPSLFFSGLDLRSFTWQWKLVPRNERESRALIKVIQNLKKKILPAASAVSLKYPHMVLPSIETASKRPTMLNDFKYSMVKTMTINYTPEGVSAFFVNGEPVSLDLNIEFQEMEYQYSEFIDTDPNAELSNTDENDPVADNSNSSTNPGSDGDQ